jgi:hypothetical protein
MSLFDNAVRNIDQGRAGGNEGLPMGFERLVQYVPNLQIGTYYLVGAGTGIGKTAFTDQGFMYEPFEYVMNLGEETDIELDIDYFSYEIDSTVKVIKGISRNLYKRHGLIADVNYILSKGRNRISQEVYDLVMKERVYFEELEKRLHVFDMPENPTGVNKYLRAKSQAHGKEFYKEIDTVNEQGQPIKLKVFDHYVPNNPKRYHVAVVDHVSLSKQEKGMNVKETIDKLSQYMIQWRNNYGGIPVMVQQLSFDSQSSDRAKLKKVTPTLADFGDSKYTTRDANVVLSLFSPMSAELPTFMGGPGHSGYDINRLKDNFRALEILKGRDGGIGTRIGLQYVGAAGVMKELPRASEMTEAHYKRVLELK